MVEMLAATLTVPDAPLVFTGVTIQLAPPAARFSLRGRDAEMLGQESGLSLPGRIGDFTNGVARLGPDEWLAILPAGAVVGRGAGQPIGIVDVSSRSIGIIVEGPDAADVISAGCPLDLARITPGRATRTLFETVEIILVRTSETRFHIEVWRSFAPWLFGALSAAAS
jgi:sarcosine oxidase subunit gamma